MRRGSEPANRDIASTLSQKEIVTNSLSLARSSRNSWTPTAFSSERDAEFLVELPSGVQVLEIVTASGRTGGDA